MKNQQPCIGDNTPAGTFFPHSRFDSVVNFINDQSQLAYLTTNEDLLAANAVFLPGMNLKLANSLVISSQKIILNDISYSRKEMKIYHSELNFDNLDTALFESRVIQIPDLFPELFPEKKPCISVQSRK